MRVMGVQLEVCVTGNASERALHVYHCGWCLIWVRCRPDQGDGEDEGEYEVDAIPVSNSVEISHLAHVNSFFVFVKTYLFTYCIYIYIHILLST